MCFERFALAAHEFLRDGLPCLAFFIAFRLYLTRELQFRPVCAGVLVNESHSSQSSGVLEVQRASSMKMIPARPLRTTLQCYPEDLLLRLRVVQIAGAEKD